MALPLDGPGLGVELAAELWQRADARTRRSAV